eukprot:scaffold69732_cov69-Phaeocystis_antarctica.AAC.3
MHPRFANADEQCLVRVPVPSSLILPKELPSVRVSSPVTGFQILTVPSAARGEVLAIRAIRHAVYT